MKKIFLSFAAALAAFNVYSQGFDIRAFGGIGLISITAQNSYNTYNGVDYTHYYTTSPLIQFGVATTFGSRFFVQPGITWQSVDVTNTNVMVDGAKTQYDDELLLNMITVPLKVGWRLIEPKTENALNVRIFGGIDGQFVTKVDQKKESGLIPPVTKEQFNKLITYADMGMGLDILFLFADAGYRIGLNPFLSSGENSKSNMFYANVGVRIRL